MGHEGSNLAPLFYLTFLSVRFPPWLFWLSGGWVYIPPIKLSRLWTFASNHNKEEKAKPEKKLTLFPRPVSLQEGLCPAL